MRGGHEGIIPVDNFFDHVQLVVMVVDGRVALPTQLQGVAGTLGESREGHGAVQGRGEGGVGRVVHVIDGRHQLKTGKNDKDIHV